MDAELLAERLKEAAEAAGLEVREGPADSEGAAVRLRGKTVVFLPAGVVAAKRVDILARALAPLDLEGMFLIPAVREAIERARRELRA